MSKVQAKAQAKAQAQAQAQAQENTTITQDGVEVLTPTFTEEFQNAFTDTQRNDTVTDVVIVNKAGAETSFLHEDALKPFVADINRIKAAEKASQMSRLTQGATMAHMMRNGAYKALGVTSCKAMIDKCGIVSKDLSRSMCEKLVSVGDKFLYLDENGETHYKDGIPHLPLSSLMELTSYAIPETDAFGKEITDDNGLVLWNIQPVRDFCAEHGISSFWSEKRIKELKSKLIAQNKPVEHAQSNETGTGAQDTDGAQKDGAQGAQDGTATATPPHSRAARLNNVIHGLEMMLTYVNEFGTDEAKNGFGAVNHWLMLEKKNRDKALKAGESEVWLSEE